MQMESYLEARTLQKFRKVFFEKSLQVYSKGAVIWSKIQ